MNNIIKDKDIHYVFKDYNYTHKTTMFNFTNYLRENYEYISNSIKGDVYVDKITKNKFSEYEVYVKWKIKYYGQ